VRAGACSARSNQGNQPYHESNDGAKEGCLLQGAGRPGVRHDYLASHRQVLLGFTPVYVAAILTILLAGESQPFAKNE
jgi:hypothetical protein